MDGCVEVVVVGGSVGHRRLRALGVRRHFRRGQIDRAHRHHPLDHGQPALRRHEPAPTTWSRQHRRSLSNRRPQRRLSRRPPRGPPNQQVANLSINNAEALRAPSAARRSTCTLQPRWIECRTTAVTSGPGCWGLPAADRLCITWSYSADVHRTCVIRSLTLR